jgi:branched-chain amino acid transport system permease protein
MTQLLLFNVTNGLIIGAFYVLMALGLSLILNLSNVINFAHGGFLVIGGYIAYTITPYVGFWGALLLAPPLTAVIGLAVERVLIRPLYGRDPLYSLLLTFGLAFIIEDGTRFIWGAQGKPVTIPTFLAQPLSNDLFFITGYRLFMVAVVMIAPARSILRPSRHSGSMCKCCARSISASAFIWRVSAAFSPPGNWGLSRPWAPAF